MRIAIIGGSGFIGTALSTELTRAGHSVFIISRRAEDNDGSGWLRWNGADLQKLASILQDFNAVVNLAGENIGAKPWSGERKALLVSSRIPVTSAVSGAIRSMKKPPEIFVQASAVGYYGTGDEKCNEFSKNGSDWLASLCKQWEDASSVLGSFPTRKVILRSGVVFGRERSVLQRLVLPFRLFAGGNLGNGEQWVSWIHILDEVGAIRFLIENPEASGVYNLTSPEPVTNEEIGRKIAKLLRRPYLFTVPASLLRLALGEMSTLVLDGQRVMPERLLQSGYPFRFPGVDEALADLLR